MKLIQLIDSNFGVNDYIYEDTDHGYKFTKDNCYEVVLTDNHLHLVDELKRQGKKVSAWLIEPPEVSPAAHNWIQRFWDKFDNVYTHTHLHNSTNHIYVPFGGCWISNPMKPKKTKMISFISSNKKFASGHILRHDIINQLSGFDLFGVTKRIDNKEDSLLDYKFQIVVENQKMSGWFTEKILDCFAIYTIPIYYGDPNIGDIFDSKSIITFDTIGQLKAIIDDIDSIDYDKLIKSMDNNFKSVEKYRHYRNNFFRGYK